MPFVVGAARLYRMIEAEPPTTGFGPFTAVPPGRAFVSRIDEYEIHAREYGSGEPVLLLLHGLSGSSRWWSRNIPELARSYRLLVPDLIGFGRSRTVEPLPDIDRLSLLLRDWLTTLGIPRVVLAGHSMGGQVAIHFAANAGDRLERLVLIDSAGIPRRISAGTLLRFAADVAPLWRWGDPTFLPVIAGDALSAGPRVLLRAIHHILRDDVRPLLPGIDVPTLIIWGERDTVIPLQDGVTLRDSIPGSRLAVLRGAAHNPMVDRPADFNRLLRRFVDGEAVGR